MIEEGGRIEEVKTLAETLVQTAEEIVDEKPVDPKEKVSIADIEEFAGSIEPPDVSIPGFDREKFLHHALKSVKLEALQDRELLKMVRFSQDIERENKLLASLRMSYLNHKWLTAQLEAIEKKKAEESKGANNGNGLLDR